MKNKEIHVRINGNPTTISSDLSAKKLVESQNRWHAMTGLAVNGKYVNRSSYSEVYFNEGDEIKLFFIMGGG